MKKILIVVFSLILMGCGNKGVTQVHWDKAVEMCSGNGGVQSISDSTWNLETERCGFKCSKETGRKIYNEEFSCKNGAEFKI